MAINVNVQYNGGLLPDIILSVDPMLSASGNLFEYGNAMKRFCICSL